MSDTLAEFKETYPVVIKHPVPWGDMDALGHVNNVVYFRYFENIRIAYMRSLGLFGSAEFGPVIAETSARYRRPVVFPDTLRVGARVTELHEFGCLQEYGIFSTEQDTIVTLGSARIVMLDRSGRKHPVPDALRLDIERLEQKALV